MQRFFTAAGVTGITPKRASRIPERAPLLQMVFFFYPPLPPGPLPEVRPASRPTRGTATADQAECRSRLPSPVNSFHRHEDCAPPRRGDRVWAGGGRGGRGRGRGLLLATAPSPLLRQCPRCSTSTASRYISIPPY